MDTSAAVLPVVSLSGTPTTRPFTVKLLDWPDEVVETIMLACDPYSAIAMTQSCRYLDERFNNEVFWKRYSEPMRYRHLLPGEVPGAIKEDTYLEYVTARAKPLS